MPWCEPCSKYLTPTAMSHDGTCPECGKEVQAVTAENLDLKKLADGDVGVPWHFTLLVVLLVAYLGWRFIALFL